MADIDNDGVKERYDSFVQHLYQYITIPIKDFATIKPQILMILKTHRAIKKSDYQYGISRAGKEKCQLIVQECDQRSMVREYFKEGKNTWKCCECAKIGATSQESSDLIIAHGIVFVKLKHECPPRKLSFVMEVQKLYKDGKKDEAAALQKSVLGSEDAVSTKSVAIKRETKPPKPSKAIADQASRQYSAKENNDVVQELQPSIMDEQLDENQEIRPPEDVFAEIIENLQEYTNEATAEILKNKSMILRVLKADRPVKMADYHYGLSRTLARNRRLIVFEWNDRRRVREYCKRNDNKTLWSCRECYRLWCLHNRVGKEEHVRASLHFINGIAFVPINHNCKCNPRDYELVMQYQKFLESGDTVKARRMDATIDYTFYPNSSYRIVNKIDAKVSEDINHHLKEIDNDKNSFETLTNSKRKLLRNDENSLNNKSPVHKKSKLDGETENDTVLAENHSSSKKSKQKKVTSGVLMNEADLNQSNKSVNDKQRKTSKRKKNKENQSDGEAETIREMKLKVPSVTSTSRFAFEKPTTLTLEKICNKLNVRYRNKAMKLWDEILFKQIDTESSPNVVTHEFRTENFYEILSKLFTGKSKHRESIKETLLQAFRAKLVRSGEMPARKFNKHFWKNTVTDKHLCFIAKFLSCRILIYDLDESEIQMYGKWKESSKKRVTLVLSFSEGFYSVVLKL